MDWEAAEDIAFVADLIEACTIEEFNLLVQDQLFKRVRRTAEMQLSQEEIEALLRNGPEIFYDFEKDDK